MDSNFSDIFSDVNIVTHASRAVRCMYSRVRFAGVFVCLMNVFRVSCIVIVVVVVLVV